MELTILNGISLWAVTEAIIKVIKVYQPDTKFLPLFNVLVGLAVTTGAAALGLVNLGIGESIYAGLVVGLSAGGFYDFRKELTRGL